MSVVLSILIMIFMLSILVVVHEWGHFIVARLFKVKVNEFSIFMGPKLFQRTSKKTGMKFSIRALPFGGYCALEGEVEDDAPEDPDAPVDTVKFDDVYEPEASDDPEKFAEPEAAVEPETAAEPEAADELETAAEPEAEREAVSEPARGEYTFSSRPWYQRALILLAGVTMNYVLAVLIISLIFAFNGYDTRRVSSVSDDAPMTIAGLEPGDVILEYNGKTILDPVDYSLYNIVGQPEDVTFTVKKRDGTKLRYGFDRHIEINANEGADKEANPGTVSVRTDVYILTGRKYKSRTELGTYYAYWDNNRALTITLNCPSGERIEYYYGERDGEKGLYITRWPAGSSTPVTEHPTNLHHPAEGEKQLTDAEYVDAFITEYNEYQSYARFGFSYTYGERGNFFTVIGHAFIYTHSLIKSVFLSLWYLITGKLGLTALSGPIGITGIVNDVVTSKAASSSLKFAALAEMTALISANLAVINLFPIPGLDG
ncbi:MAG: site-2 protease family protein, partial [Clostridia bacterium]|nr:site-2 protease family protein [Clostridia bacterium]